MADTAVPLDYASMIDSFRVGTPHRAHWCQLKPETLDKYRFYLSLDPPKSPFPSGTLIGLLSPPS